MNSKILITGGSGFIGTNLVDEFIDCGWDVINIDNLPPRKIAHKNYWRKCDIRDLDFFECIARDFSPQLIIHLAARTDLDGSNLNDYDSNTIGVSNLVKIAKKLPSLKRIVFASSMLVCRLGYHPTDINDYCPDTVYGRSKMIGEKIVNQCASGELSWTIVRPTSIWGPWFDVPYRNFFDAIRRQQYLHPSGMRIHRSYGFVCNTTYQLRRMITSDEAVNLDQKVYYIADYHPIELFDWSSKIAACFQVRPIPEVPLTLLKMIASTGDMLKLTGIKRFPLTTARLQNLMTDAVFNIEPLHNIVGELPYNVDQAVDKTVKWMQGK